MERTVLCSTAKYAGQCLLGVNPGSYRLGPYVSFHHKRTNDHVVHVAK
jgi:hypothetical protein